MKIVLINGLLFCLVFVWASAATQPEPESDVYENGSRVGIQLRRKKCGNIGGWCIKTKRDCPKCLPLETEPGRPYCSKSRRCCYPDEIVPPTKGPILEEIVCGTETLSSTRIVNGVDVQSRNTFPWQVGIKNTFLPGVKFYCGGTVLSKKHILTAAHCFYEKTGTPQCRKKDPEDVYVGSGNIKQDKTVIRLVSNIIFGKYKCQTDVNDIAILTVSHPFDSIKPICLPRDGRHDGVSKGIIIGWGSTEGYNPSTTNPPEVLPNVLQKARVPIISNEQCSSLVGGGKVKDTMICTSTGNGFNGTPPGNGTCQGDSGGPLLVCKPGPIKQCVQIGITSFGDGCASYNNPDVLTRVSKFLQFIYDNTGTEPLYYLD